MASQASIGKKKKAYSKRKTSENSKQFWNILAKLEAARVFLK